MPREALPGGGETQRPPRGRGPRHTPSRALIVGLLPGPKRRHFPARPPGPLTACLPPTMIEGDFLRPFDQHPGETIRKQELREAQS